MSASESSPLSKGTKKAPPQVKRRILVADDDETLRNFAGRMLTRAGFEVTPAADGVEAIELYKAAKASGAPFDVVLLDLIVPGGGGAAETIQRLLEIEPGVRAIVSSGYSNDPVMANFREYGFKAAVEKPYSISELTNVIEDVLSGDCDKPVW